MTSLLPLSAKNVLSPFSNVLHEYEPKVIITKLTIFYHLWHSEDFTTYFITKTPPEF